MTGKCFSVFRALAVFVIMTAVMGIISIQGIEASAANEGTVKVETVAAVDAVQAVETTAAVGGSTTLDDTGYTTEYKYRYVYDFANILSADEEEKLDEMCEKASAVCEVDFVIITTNIGHDYSKMDSYLAIFARERNFSGDCIIYGIDMVSRADRIVTMGRAQTDIPQKKLDNIRVSAENELKNDHYYRGCKKFIKGSERILTKDLFAKLTYNMGIKLLISLAVAVVVVLILMYSAKSKMTVTNTTYTKNHNFKVNNAKDIFINTTVVTRHIERSSGGGGGGGGNHGSGGHF